MASPPIYFKPFKRFDLLANSDVLVQRFEITIVLDTFYFEDRMVNLLDEHGERVYDSMEGVLTEITDPTIALHYDDLQSVADAIAKELTKQFQDFSKSTLQHNHHSRNTMHITIEKPHFEVEARNSVVNLQT
ncbi:hypothetical protein K501DRAFT_271013 [Backusella circina FSU 941]|nr:hypothetical protein K501DRAFT_271013 [Backusella circina FSU 941]